MIVKTASLSGQPRGVYNTYMLDGLPMDTFCDPMSIDPWIVERLEVQRGLASVLYPNFLSQDFSGNQSPLAGTTNFILRERRKIRERVLPAGTADSTR